MSSIVSPRLAKATWQEGSNLGSSSRSLHKQFNQRLQNHSLYYDEWCTYLYVLDQIRHCSINSKTSWFWLYLVKHFDVLCWLQFQDHFALLCCLYYWASLYQSHCLRESSSLSKASIFFKWFNTPTSIVSSKLSLQIPFQDLHQALNRSVPHSQSSMLSSSTEL